MLMENGALYNTISHSTITANSTETALRITGYASAMNNLIYASKITNTNASGTGISIRGRFGPTYSGSSNTIANCEVTGSTAIMVGSATGTVITSNILNATGESRSGVWVAFGNMNLTISSNIITAGASGSGIYFDTGTMGLVDISSNIINAGSRYGIKIGTQTSSADIFITSNTISVSTSPARDTYGIYLDGLVSGATIQNNAVAYRTPGNVSGYTAYGLYAKSVSGFNFDHNRINNPGMILGGNAISA
jgi:hypothetical protein